jgi:hypothetical protein
VKRLIVLIAACDGSGAMIDASGSSDGKPAAHDARTDDAPGGTGEPASLAGMTLAHNQVRAAVDTSGVPAGPLPYLAWDANLANYAANWAAMCRSANGALLDHNPNRTNVAGYAYIGENIYASSGAATARDAVSLWASEKQYFTYPATCAAGRTCGHYTQLVWRATTHVGCALQNCPSLTYPNTIVCDYGPGGNSGGAPY